MTLTRRTALAAALVLTASSARAQDPVRIDVIMALMSITDERLQTIDFSDPYYKTPASIVAAKGVVASPDAAGL